MKIDKRNPVHWLLMLLTGINALVAAALRGIVPRRQRLVLLYGHKLGGNLLAIYRYIRDERPDISVAFLTMEPAYHRRLQSEGIDSILASSPGCIRSLVGAAAFVSDHGLHTLVPLLWLSDLKFFDAWHAIPFKGFDAEDFRVQRSYRETWVTSPLMAEKYVNLYGFQPNRVAVTGYARTDRLVHARRAKTKLQPSRLGLPLDAGKIILFAPTWKQDDEERSLFPFGTRPDEFCRLLSELARRVGATVIFRTHLNSGVNAIDVSGYERLVNISYVDNPDTEEVLLATDVLVCDWSSIAFDFLLLDRPTIFLDVPPPFRKGFTLGPEYRFGPITQDMQGLLSHLERYVQCPEKYDEDCGLKAAEVKESIYAESADGNSARRCLARLDEVF